MISKFKYFIALILIMAGCSSQFSKPAIVVTNYPLYLIIKEIAGIDANVACIIPPGASPHTFTPKPSDVSKAQNAKVLIYVSDNFDSWAGKLGCKNMIKMIDLIPNELKIYNSEHNENHNNDSTSKTEENSNIDGHFWTDPIVVKTIIPGLRDSLCNLDPENAAAYKSNADAFVQKLEVLNMQAAATLKDVAGKSVFLFHPSFLYLLKRYGLIYGGSIEMSPGKEPSPKYIADLVKRINDSGTKAIFSEPQLPVEPAKILGEAAKVNVLMLDPYGGVKGRETYSELIMYNARLLASSLR